MRAALVLVVCGGCDVVLHLDPIQPVGDASAHMDGVPDTAIDANPTYCVTSPPAGTVFCADFDQPATGLMQFQTTVTGASNLVEDAADATSSPRSLHATLPADTVSDAAYATLTRSFAQYKGSIILDAKVLSVPACTPNVLEVQLMGGGGIITIDVTSQNGGYDLSSASTACQGGPYTLGVVPQNWNHLELQIDTGQGSVVLTNGQQMVTFTCTAVMQTTTLGVLKVGAGATAAHAACGTLVDDVVITSG